MRSGIALIFISLVGLVAYDAKADDQDKHNPSKHNIPEKPLVQNFGSRPQAAPKTCSLTDELRKETALNDGEKITMRLLVGTAALAERYEHVRKTKALQDIVLPLNAQGEALKELMRLQQYYVYSASLLSATTPEERYAENPSMETWGFHTFAYVTAEAPLFFLSALGNASVYGDFNTATKVGTPLTRSSGKSIKGTASGVGIGLIALRSFGGTALKTLTDKLSVQDQIALTKSLSNGENGRAIDFLSETLQWDSHTKEKFIAEVRSEALNTIVKTAKGLNAVQEETTIMVSVPHVVGNLNSIDLLKILESDNKFASREQIKALHDLRKLQEIVRKLNASDLTVGNAKKVLDPVADYQSVLVRFHKLHEAILKELPQDSPARAEAVQLFSESKKAIETLENLCQLGVN